MDASFDAKEWVNAAFRQQREPGVSLDVSNPVSVLILVCTLYRTDYLLIAQHSQTQY